MMHDIIKIVKENGFYVIQYMSIETKLFELKCFKKDGEWFVKEGTYGTINDKILNKDTIKRLNNFERKEKLSKLLEK